MILDFGVTHAQAGTGFLQDVGRVGHAFHATGDHHLIAAGFQRIEGHHHGLHARAAQLVDGGATGGGGQAGVERGLARRALLEPCRQDAAHDHFLHVG
jgi:hypothetical protein